MWRKVWDVVVVRASKTWPVAIVVALAGVIAGLLGSVYSDDIKTSIPLTWLSADHHAAWFWGIFGFTTLALGSRGYSVDRARKEAEDELRNSAQEMMKLIRTMPPEDFLANFALLYREAHHAATQARIDVGATDTAIRVVLRSVALLAYNFDRLPDEERYAANVMLFKTKSDVEINEIRTFMAFDSKLDESAISGVLVLQRDLSTSHDSPDAAPDATLNNLVLAIPNDLQTEAGRWTALPGAPIAFALNGPDIHGDTADHLERWFEEAAELPGDTKRTVLKYFREEKIGSFVSLPLSVEEEMQPIGVLNLHRRGPGMLGQADREDPATVEQFSWVAHPFVLVLIDLLSKRAQMNGGTRV